MFCQHMHWAPSICMMGPQSSTNFPPPPHSTLFYTTLETSTVKDEETVIVYGTPACVFLLCVFLNCVCVIVSACVYVCITQVYTCKSCPFRDHANSTACTTAPWLPYYNRGHLSAIWGTLLSFFLLPFQLPYQWFPQRNLFLTAICWHGMHND